jgi:hypothetical protein
MSLTKMKALFLMSVVFLIGTIVGGSLGTAIVSRKFASPQFPEKAGPEKMIQKFKGRLHLSPTQTDKVQRILSDAHNQFCQLHETVKPQFDEIRSRIRTQIREELNEDQRNEFEVMVREFDERRARERH